MKIRFERDLRAEGRGITPQRLAAARRAIEKDRENNALTPELVKPYNVDPETRIEHADNRYLFVARALRDHNAKCWRKGRRMLTEMTPEMKEACLGLWNREMYPLTGTYFAEHCRRCLERPEEIHEFLAFLKRRNATVPSESLVERDRLATSEKDDQRQDEERDDKPNEERSGQIGDRRLPPASPPLAKEEDHKPNPDDRSSNERGDSRGMTNPYHHNERDPSEEDCEDRSHFDSATPGHRQPNQGSPPSRENEVLSDQAHQKKTDRNPDVDQDRSPCATHNSKSSTEALSLVETEVQFCVSAPALSDRSGPPPAHQD